MGKMPPQKAKFFEETLFEAVREEGWRKMVLGLSDTLMAELEVMIEKCSQAQPMTFESAKAVSHMKGQRRVIILIEPKERPKS